MRMFYHFLREFMRQTNNMTEILAQPVFLSYFKCDFFINAPLTVVKTYHNNKAIKQGQIVAPNIFMIDILSIGIFC